MQTLLYHTGAIGDFVTTIPALAYWKKSHPHDRLTLIGNPWIGDVARDAGLIEECWDVNGARAASLFSGAFPQNSKALFARFAAAIAFTVHDYPLVSNMRKAGIGNIVHQSSVPGSGMHVVDYRLSLFVDPQKLPDDEKLPLVNLPETAVSASLEIVPAETTFCVLHPGSGSKKKNWPVERFYVCADRLREKGFSVAWIRGPAEEKFVFPKQDRVIFNANLSMVAALCSRCTVFIGNDSGITHLAAATGCRTIAIFGPSDPRTWGPRGKHVTILCKKRNCSPCHLRSAPAVAQCDGECLKEITVEEVLLNSL